MVKVVQFSIVALAFIFLPHSSAYSDVSYKDKGRTVVEELIWALEEEYFTNLLRGRSTRKEVRAL
jgi:hypothetical protein